MTSRLDVAIVQSMLIASVGVLFYYMMQALGLRQMAGLMRVVVAMVIISVLVPTVWAVLLGIIEGIQSFVDWVDGVVNKITFWR